MDKSNADKTLDEWITLYEQKTGKPFERMPGFQMFYFPERGFCEIAADTEHKIVIAYQLCGDGKFWRRFIEGIAQTLRYPCCGTFCVRHIKPYIRFWGAKIDRVELTDDGLERYHCTAGHGVKLTCSPAWRDDETGELTYSMTWEVKYYEQQHTDV